MKLRNLWDYYPVIFSEEKKAYEEYQYEKEFEDFKERRVRFAIDHNARYGGGAS